MIDSGAMVLLTNVANVWEPPANRRRVLYEDFRIHNGRRLEGVMRWGDWGASGGRPMGSDGPVSLTGAYDLAWRDYSAIGAQRLRYLLVEVAGS